MFMSNWFYVPCISACCTIFWLRYRRKICDEKTEVFFYEPQTDICSCSQSIKAPCLNPNVCPSKKTKNIVDCIRNAEKSIDICMYTISSEPIAEAIIYAHARNIKIRIVISNCVLMNSKEISAFQKLGINIKFQSSKNVFMHNKFALVDSKWLIHGSMNWTRQATFLNWENFLITNKQSLVTQFSKGFETIWQAIS